MASKFLVDMTKPNPLAIWIITIEEDKKNRTWLTKLTEKYRYKST